MISNWAARMGSVGAKRRESRLLRRLDGYCSQFHQAYENLCYNIEENGEGRVLDILGQNLTAPRVFDVGANIGDWSLRAAHAMPDAQIESFEIVSTTHEQLRKNCTPYSRINTHSFGLSDAEGEVDIFCLPDASILATCIPGITESFHAQKPATERGHVIVGDQFCRTNEITDIDFLKIDVEGYEWRVLSGFNDMLNAGQIRVIQFEYGYVNIAVKVLLKDFYDLLSPLGFIIGKIYPNTVEFRNYRYQHEDFLGPNFLAVHESCPHLIAALKKSGDHDAIRQ